MLTDVCTDRSASSACGKPDAAESMSRAIAVALDRSKVVLERWRATHPAAGDGFYRSAEAGEACREGWGDELGLKHLEPRKERAERRRGGEDFDCRRGGDSWGTGVRIGIGGNSSRSAACA